MKEYPCIYVEPKLHDIHVDATLYEVHPNLRHHLSPAEGWDEDGRLGGFDLFVAFTLKVRSLKMSGLTILGCGLRRLA